MKKVSYWVSASWATARVDVENDWIVDTAPIFERFIGQRFVNLLTWLQRNSKEAVRFEVLEDADNETPTKKILPKS